MSLAKKIISFLQERAGEKVDLDDVCKGILYPRTEVNNSVNAMIRQGRHPELRKFNKRPKHHGVIGNKENRKTKSKISLMYDKDLSK